VRYNTSSKLPKFYQDNRALKDNVSMDRHFFVIHFEGMKEFRYAYRPVREVKRCICIEMLYVMSGGIYYLRLILLNRKARSDKDVLTYVPVRGGGEPIVCSSHQQSAIAHGYVDSVQDVTLSYNDMCSNGTASQ